MKRSTKKGFTIVELVIVIAIIAILAAVLIPTFASLIQKANVSKDTQLVRNLNTALVADNAEHKTMQSALDAAAAFGYDVGKINASAMGNEILWDSENDVFCYLKDGKVEYIPETVLKVAKDKVATYDYWQICTKVPSKQEYSIYWNSEADFGTTALTVGFDAGKCNAITKLEYKGTDAAQDVVIRTNGGELVVNAANDHVEHYGLAKVVDVQAVSEATYVEHGTVAKMTLAENAKNVIIKSTAVVVELTNSSPKVAIEGDAYVGEVKGTSANVSGNHGGDTIKVGTYDQLQALALASTLEIKLTGKTIELTADIDLTGKVWTPFGFSRTAPFDGIIDGKGHTIKGLSAAGYSFKEKAWITNTTNGNQGPAYGFVCIAKDATIKNLKFTDVNIDVENGLAIGAVVGDARGSSLTIENVTVDGSVKAMDKVGGFVGLAGYNDSTNFVLTIGNSVNNADVVAVCDNGYNRAGGFVGGLGGSEKFKDGGKVEFVSCTNNGNVTVTGCKEKETTTGNQGLIVMAGGFIGAVNGGKTITVTPDCINNGTITVTNTKYDNSTKTITGMTAGSRYDEGWVKVYPIYDGYTQSSGN